MKLKTVLCVAIVALTPTLGLAMGCGPDHREASTCPDGQVWNSGLQLCVDQANT